MPDNLEELFLTYTNSFQLKLHKGSKATTEKGPWKLFINKALELQTLVDDIESNLQFRHLIAETRSGFSGDYHGKNEWAWRQAVKNFFRRSGYYVDVLEGKSPDREGLFLQYRQAFQRREIQITYLAPLKFVYFAVPSMDFGAFQIRRFTVKELESFLQNRVNRIFCSWAVADAERLKDYWFIQITETIPMARLGLVSFWSELDQVDVEYTQYPKAVESVLQVLALFDWQADWWKGSPVRGQVRQQEDLETGWFGFDIPFVLRVDDDLLSTPRGAPDLSRLQTEPLIDSSTGEEIGTVPAVCIHLDDGETALFRDFVQQTQ